MIRSPSVKHERAVRELTRVRDLVLKLQELLRDPHGNNQVVAAEDLVHKVLISVSDALCVLSQGDENVAVTDEWLSSAMLSPGEGDLRPKKFVKLKDCTGGSRTRRYPDVHRIFSTQPHAHDGYLWKKYGQKRIFGAKYQRNYFKCTQRQSQGCLATKHVQQTTEDPSTFAITYIGAHTCQDPLQASELLLLEAADPKKLFSLDFKQKGGVNSSSSATNAHSTSFTLTYVNSDPRSQVTTPEQIPVREAASTNSPSCSSGSDTDPLLADLDFIPGLWSSEEDAFLLSLIDKYDP